MFLEDIFYPDNEHRGERARQLAADCCDLADKLEADRQEIENP